MITRILQFAIHQRLLMILLGIGLVALGAWNFTRLPIDEDRVSFAAVLVTCQPGWQEKQLEGIDVHISRF